MGRKFRKGDKVVGRKSGKDYIVVRGYYQHRYLPYGDDYIPYYIVKDVVSGREKRVYEIDLKLKRGSRR